MKSTNEIMKMCTLVDLGYEPSKQYVCTHAEVSMLWIRFKQDDQAVLITEISVFYDRNSRIYTIKKKLVWLSLQKSMFFKIKLYHFFNKSVFNPLKRRNQLFIKGISYAIKM